MIRPTMVTTDASRMFTIQDVIVKQMVEQLSPRLSANVSTRIATVGTRNNDAYEAYVRGRAIVLEPTPSNLKRAAELFQQAVNLDLSSRTRGLPWLGVQENDPVAEVPPDETFRKPNRPLSGRSRFSPSMPRRTRCWAQSRLVRLEYGEAERRCGTRSRCSRAPRTPRSPAIVYSHLGRHDDALEGIRRARALDLAAPAAIDRRCVPDARAGIRSRPAASQRAARRCARLVATRMCPSYALLGLERYEEAVRRANEAIELRRTIDNRRDPTRSSSARRVSRSHVGTSRGSEELCSRSFAPKVVRLTCRNTTRRPPAGLSEENEAMNRLEAAILRRDFMLTYLGVLHIWDELRDHERFRRILSQVNLLGVSDRIPRQLHLKNNLNPIHP